MSKKEEHNTSIEAQVPWYILVETVAKQNDVERRGKMRYLVGEVRYKKGLSLRCLAERSGVTKSYLQRIEAGEAKPSLEIMVRIARALESALDELYRED